LSQEKVLKTLESLGLTKSDAQIYIFLGKKGPQKAIDILKSLKMPRQTLYPAIKDLQGKGIVTATLEHPAKFSAVPFERVLDLFVKAKTEEIQRIQVGRKDLLSDWQSISITETGDESSKFAIIEGRNYIYPRLKQMIEKTKNMLSVISTVPSLVQADQFGLLDAVFSHASEPGIHFRFLTELPEQNLGTMKTLIDRARRAKVSFEARVPELGLKLFTRIVIRDSDEAVFFITPRIETGEQKTDACLWTNCKSLVNSFSAVFEDLWRNSTDIEKLVKIETGKSLPEIRVSRDKKEASCISPPDEKRFEAYRNAFGFEETKETAFLGAEEQKEIMEKIINARRTIVKNSSEEALRFYGSIAQAFIHPPEGSELPDMIIYIAHDNKQSSFGENDSVTIFLPLNTEKGCTHVPVAIITNNPDTRFLAFLMSNLAGTPAEHNCRIVGRDQLDVRVQGNNLFASWTVPVPLLPPKYVLSPGCILFEGEGDLRTTKHTRIAPSGRKQIAEVNGFEAFVTFLSPSVKYRGPGTEGMFFRDSITTSIPASSA